MGVKVMCGTGISHGGGLGSCPADREGGGNMAKLAETVLNKRRPQEQIGGRRGVERAERSTS